MIRKIKIQGYRIHKDLTVEPNRKFNLIAGANESGKSTLMEGVALALTGRINGRSIFEELNPWGSTPLTRTLPRRPMIGKKECHVQAKKVQRGV